MTTVRAPGTKMPSKQVVVIQKTNTAYDNLKTDPPPKIPTTPGG